MKPPYVTRRKLLQAGAAVGVAAGLPGMQLTALSPLYPYKHVIFVFVPGGAPPGQWLPQGCAERFALAPVSAPLEPIKQHCLFFKGIRVDHASPGTTFRVLGCDVAKLDTRNTTVDILIGRELKPHNRSTHTNLFLSSTDLVQTFDDAVSMENGEQVAYDSDPVEVYRRFFDEDAGYANVLHKNFTAGSIDVGDFGQVTDRNSELAVLALQNNRASVVTLMMGGASGQFSAPESGFSGSYYQAMQSASLSDYARFRTFLTARLAYLLRLLAGTHGFGRPLIETTLVVQVTESGAGPDQGVENAPYLMAGAVDFLQTGRIVEGGGHHYNVLQTACRYAGLPDDLIGTPIVDAIKV